MPDSITFEGLTLEIERYVEDDNSEQQFRSSHPERLSYRIRFFGQLEFNRVAYMFSLTLQNKGDTWVGMYAGHEGLRLLPVVWRTVDRDTPPTPAAHTYFGSFVGRLVESKLFKAALITGWDQAQTNWMSANADRALALRTLADRYEQRRSALPPIPRTQKVRP